MKHARRSDITVDGINHGFSLDSSIKLRRTNDTMPSTQIWSSTSDDDSVRPEQRRHYCAICHGPLAYLAGSNTAFRCDNCNEYYDTSIQDTPIKNITKFKATPHSEIQRYPSFDSEDAPFVKAVDLNDTVDIENRSYEGNRIQRINLHNTTFAEAMKAGALSAKDEDED